MPETQEYAIAEGASSVGDLFKRVQKGSLISRYLKLLHRAATDGYPIGAQETTEWEAEAFSDWDAAACVPKTTNDAGYEQEVTLDDIEEVRERLGRAVVQHGSRKGEDTFRLNPKLL